MTLLGVASLLGPVVADADSPRAPAPLIAAADTSAAPDTSAIPVPAVPESASVESAPSATGASPVAASSLAATSGVPWSPPRPVAAERPWESVARIPGRIVSLPLSVVGYAFEGGLLFVEEYEVVPRVAAYFAHFGNIGLRLGPASLGDRTGWGGQVAYAPPPIPWLQASMSGSTAQYNRAHVALLRHSTGFEYQFDWRSRDPFFGVGRHTSDEDAANYAARIEAVRFIAKWPHGKPPPDHADMILPDPVGEPPVNIPGRHEVWAWAGPRNLTLSRGRDPSEERPSIEERFPSLAPQLGHRLEHFIYGVHLGRDTRQGRPHWSHGWRLAAEAERFDQPIEALALHDASTPSMSFTRLMYEGEVGWSFFRDPRTFRLYARVQDLRSFSDDGMFLISDLSRLGGGQGLFGFEPGRFHDADLMIGRLSYIFPLVRYMELDLHGELGNVYPRLEDARLTTMEHSFGLAFRVRTPRAPLASIGVDVSREKVRLRFGVGGVE